MKVKVKKLYEEGRANNQKPGSFSVLLERYGLIHGDTYFLSTEIVTYEELSDPSGINMVMGGKTRYVSTSVVKVVSNVSSDSDAIRAAIDAYDDIEEHGVRQYWRKCNEQ